MIWLDATKTGAARHFSGLNRVGARLQAELGDRARACSWEDLAKGRVRPARSDWFLTAEVFAPDERPGFAEFAAARPCRLAAVFHDAIPLRLPHVTWPRSVARHPAYLSMLHGFDQVFAVSRASGAELTGFWAWQSRMSPPPVRSIPMGANGGGEGRAEPGTNRPGLAGKGAGPKPDGVGEVRAREPGSDEAPTLISVGILEPRKNQQLLLDVAEKLWGEGILFELHLVGRVNPYFGRPVTQRVRVLARRFPGLLRFHGAAGDEAVAALYRRARASLFPSLAEGCGLPVLESLWHGVPCLCSDLPPLLETAEGGGCLPLPAGDLGAWTQGVRRIVQDADLAGGLAAQARSRALPVWADTAREILRTLT